MLLNPDNVILYWLVVALLCGAVVAAGVASVDGLLHAAEWASPGLRWTLPVAVDVFLVGTALATLALRKRGAYWATIGCALVTLILVSFSASANWLYVYTSSEPGSDAQAYGPWIKAAMPVLLLAATEIVASLTSTRNNRENSPLNRAKRDLAQAKKDLRELRRQVRAAAAPTEVEVER